MKKFKKIFKRLFCKHNYGVVKTEMASSGIRKLQLLECKKCKKVKVIID